MSADSYDSGRLNLPFVGLCTFGKYPNIEDWSGSTAILAAQVLINAIGRILHFRE